MLMIIKQLIYLCIHTYNKLQQSHLCCVKLYCSETEIKICCFRLECDNKNKIKSPHVDEVYEAGVGVENNLNKTGSLRCVCILWLL